MTFEIVHQLDREITTAELCGRKFFRDITRLFPQIYLDSDLPHEEVDWSLYTLKVPTHLLLQSSDNIKIDVTDDYIYLHLSFEESTELPLEAISLYKKLRTVLNG